jgi:hypothetical protein
MLTFARRATDLTEQMWPVTLLISDKSYPAASTGVTKRQQLLDDGGGFLGDYDITFQVRRELVPAVAVGTVVTLVESSENYRVIACVDRTGSPVLVLRAASVTA